VCILALVLEAFVFLLAVMAMATTSIAFVVSANAPSPVSKMGNMLKTMFIYLSLFWFEYHFFHLKKLCFEKIRRVQDFLKFLFPIFFFWDLKRLHPKVA